MVSRAIRLERQQPPITRLAKRGVGTAFPSRPKKTRRAETAVPTLAQSGELLKGGEHLVDFFAVDCEIGDGSEGVWAGVEQAHVHPVQALGQVGGVPLAGVDENHVRLGTGFIHR